MVLRTLCFGGQRMAQFMQSCMMNKVHPDAQQLADTDFPLMVVAVGTMLNMMPTTAVSPFKVDGTSTCSGANVHI